MDFVARWGFAILIVFAVLIFGMLMMDAVAPYVNHIHEALSVKD